MKLAIINKSDSTGGAAVVSRRLTEAFRAKGVDARMLVCEKLTDSPYVVLAAPKFLIKWKFLFDRLKIFLTNGFKRSTLFKIDTGGEGLPLWKHPWVRESDAVLLNWVNQGMLSLKGVKRIVQSGKTVIITMHDMWWMTGICHHAGKCDGFHKQCRKCPFLRSKTSLKSLAYKTWREKEIIYSIGSSCHNLTFVSVSSWLAEKSRQSSLLSPRDIVVIPNVFSLPPLQRGTIGERCGDTIRILFGAARLDDPIKGLDTLKDSLMILQKDYPEIASNVELAVFGAVKNPEALDGFAIPVVKLGVVAGEEKLADVYHSGHIVVSASSYETLPGTLVEAQAYGCIPVGFDRGGQSDIITHGKTGYLAEYSDDRDRRAVNLAEGLLWALGIVADREAYRLIGEEMKRNVKEKFSESAVVDKYITLIRKHGL